MPQRTELSLDDQGRILVPPEIQSRLGLIPGMTLVVEKGDNGDMLLSVRKNKTILVERKGVLIARGKPMKDLVNIARDERDRRNTENMAGIYG
ncbi:hypothetical protein QUF80_03220 [Desulfococcaceae bacterium HSG8]|nr:hypothetical protein [Desulfococcaceae bacterium HSG8]